MGMQIMGFLKSISQFSDCRYLVNFNFNFNLFFLLLLTICGLYVPFFIDILISYL